MCEHVFDKLIFGDNRVWFCCKCLKTENEIELEKELNEMDTMYSELAQENRRLRDVICDLQCCGNCKNRYKETDKYDWCIKSDSPVDLRNVHKKCNEWQRYGD